MERGISPRKVARWHISRAVGVFAVAALLTMITHPGMAQDGFGTEPTGEGGTSVSAEPGSTDPVVDQDFEASSGTLGDFYGRRGSSDDVVASEPPSMFVRYMQTLGWLVIVVAIAIGSIFALRKVRNRTQLFGGGSARLMEVVSRVALGAKHQLVLVRVGEQVLVLGLSPDGIRRIGELTDPRQLQRATRGQSFSEQMDAQSSAISGDDPGGDVFDDLESGSEFTEVESSPGAYTTEPTEDDGLEPYRHEIERLRSMVGNWRLQNGRGGTP